jgi:hypothetical protein
MVVDLPDAWCSRPSRLSTAVPVLCAVARSFVAIAPIDGRVARPMLTGDQADLELLAASYPNVHIRKV